jgi:hypothetical protein
VIAVGVVVTLGFRRARRVRRAARRDRTLAVARGVGTPARDLLPLARRQAARSTTSRARPGSRSITATSGARMDSRARSP